MQTFTGVEYLRMDIASAFGKDKSIWQERLAWFQDHEHIVCLADDNELKDFVRGAKEPAQALAGIFAYRDYMAGKPSGYQCGLDATASGLQLLSLLAGCEKSAATCNLINTGKREDAYTALYEAMTAALNTEATLPHKEVKQALMTHLYGSRAVPKNTFGEDTEELACFYQQVDELLPGADALNRALISMWDPTALAHSWIMADGFDVVIKVMDTIKHEVTILGTTFAVYEKVNQEKKSGLSLGANIIHAIDGMIVREMGRRCNYNVDQVLALQGMLASGCRGGRSVTRQKDLALLRVLELASANNFLSSVILDFIDEQNIGFLDMPMRIRLANLIDTLPMAPFELICIHDCFKFHPNNGNDVRKQYKQILSSLAASDILQEIASQISGKPKVINKLSDKLPQLILDSEYAIC